jgi:hypothetical protein
MNMNVIAFPGRIVRALTEGQPTGPRFSAADLDVLQRRWSSGRHEPMATDDGVTVDRWLVPSLGSDLPVLIVTLQPNSDWTLEDDSGRVVKVGATVEAL